jgi:hypothetical protein
MKRGRVVFIDPEKQRTSGQGAYVQWFLPSGLMVTSYIQVLIKGYSKSSICLVVPPIPYVRTTDISIYPPNLAYVRQKV